jgi:hypothetical protein
MVIEQMLKAICPSIAYLPNHLPPTANITSTGLQTTMAAPLSLSNISHRSHVLRDLLDSTTTIRGHVSATHPLCLLC